MLFPEWILLHSLSQSILALVLGSACLVPYYWRNTYRIGEAISAGGILNGTKALVAVFGLFCMMYGMISLPNILMR